MCARGETTRRGRLTARRVATLAAALLLVLLAAPPEAAGPAAAQETPVQGIDAPAEEWRTLSDQVARRLADSDSIPAAELQSLRDRMAARLDEARAVEREVQPRIDELQRRLDALGPPPEGDVAEAEEVAALRSEIEAGLSEARAPLQVAQEAGERLQSLIASIDLIILRRASQQLARRAPSPLVPGHWVTAARDVSTEFADTAVAIRATLSDPGSRARILDWLPVGLALIAAAVGVAVFLRKRIDAWVETRLRLAKDRRAVAGIAVLRNVLRLVIPALGAGLLIAAIDPALVTAPFGERALFTLPDFILVLIVAGWLAPSLYAPLLPRHRLLPADADAARAGRRLVVRCGVALAVSMMLTRIGEDARMDLSTFAVLWLPVILFGALCLWQCAAEIRRIRQHVAGEAAEKVVIEEETGEPRRDAAAIGDMLLRLLERFVQAAAIVAPVLAALGYVAAAHFAVFPTLMSLGLLGAGLVVFDLLNRALMGLASRAGSTGGDPEAGLIPVLVGAAVIFCALPLLAMIWGARPTDVAEFWQTLLDGTTVAGVRISASVLIAFAIAFGFVLALTRLSQTVLRSAVLPRTRLDAGGRSAVVAGIGYTGFVVACFAGIAAAGLDLSSLAIVAGALSVGIGFGLQTIVSNFVSGIILLVERPIKEGDWIEVGQHVGYVRGINVRSTEIETFDRASVILPNSDLVAGVVLNRTHQGMAGRLVVPIGVDFGSDPREVEKILLGIAREDRRVMAYPAPEALFMGFGEHSMNFEIRCRLYDVNALFNVRSDMYFAIVERFRAAGITIPLPRRDVSIRESAAASDAETEPAKARRAPEG